MSSHVHTLIINFLCEFVNGRICCNSKGWTIFKLSCVFLSILKKKSFIKWEHEIYVLSTRHIFFWMTLIILVCVSLVDTCMLMIACTVGRLHLPFSVLTCLMLIHANIATACSKICYTWRRFIYLLGDQLNTNEQILVVETLFKLTVKFWG